MSGALSTNIANAEMKTDDQGRFSLNVIHQSYEARTGKKQPHKAPAQWSRTKQAQGLIFEIEKQTENRPLVSVHGDNGGTFAHKTLAIAYLVWLGGASVSVNLIESIENIDSMMKALRNFELPDDLPDMFVYAIREASSGNIKIGISRDPHRRLRQLQIGNSSKLELVAYRKAENRFADERAIHADEASHRLRGEWFTADAMQALQ